MPDANNGQWWALGLRETSKARKAEKLVTEPRNKKRSNQPIKSNGNGGGPLRAKSDGELQCRLRLFVCLHKKLVRGGTGGRACTQHAWRWGWRTGTASPVKKRRTKPGLAPAVGQSKLPDVPGPRVPKAKPGRPKNQSRARILRAARARPAPAAAEVAKRGRAQLPSRRRLSSPSPKCAGAVMSQTRE
ncbi:hypothetical protein HIM_01606 [Hirsutella minnesotensis 3608]|nr:hypothetical protein HIM_01606 [Hirsutella minnesotensis 3608]